MDACWHQRLASVVRFHGHLGQIEDKVANLTEELVLVDIPFSSIPASFVISMLVCMGLYAL